MPEITSFPDILQPYRAKLLLLLVGANPLPNAVAGTLLSTDEATIGLVHSRSTFGVARRLAHSLRQDSRRTAVYVQVDQADPGRIYKRVRDWLDRQDPTGTVGLNYTGGTKAMAVHAYAAVTDWARESHAQPVLSYLDAHTLSLRFAPSLSAPAGPSVQVPVGTTVRVGLQEMLSLHNWTLDTADPPESRPKWPKTAGALAKLLAEPSGWDEYRRLLNLASAALRDADAFRSLSVPSEPALATIVSIWKGELGFDIAGRGKPIEAHGHETRRWLEGEWLESYVLAILRDLAPILNLHDCMRHVVPVDRTAGTHFELDVIAVRGYQLFAFSCGLAEKRGRLKLKLLEVATRARQVGGDEARAALVCAWDEPEDLEREVRQQLGNHAVRVFGRPHLQRLKEEIQNWMES